jgi:hypothetical protein
MSKYEAHFLPLVLLTGKDAPVVNTNGADVPDGTEQSASEDRKS